MNHKDISFVTLVCMSCLFNIPPQVFAAEHAHDHGATPTNLARSRQPAPSLNSPPAKLPKLPKGVTELKFNEFFVNPVGPRGLELTEKLRGLDGKIVRILGYMAHRETQPPGVFLLTPVPVEVHDHDNALAEDFPANVVQVLVPTLRDQPVPHTPGLMLLTGTLSIGNQAEPDGRVSFVRLELDPPPTTTKGKTRGDGKNSVKGAQRLMK